MAGCRTLLQRRDQYFPFSVGYIAKDVLFESVYEQAYYEKSSDHVDGSNTATAGR